MGKNMDSEMEAEVMMGFLRMISNMVGPGSLHTCGRGSLTKTLKIMLEIALD